MTDLEQCVLLISGFVHDTDHPGYNNQYMVATRDKIALRYNDKSVLENHHISVAFSTMLKSSETRIFENFTNEEFKIMREYMIDLVLATDNIRHFSDLNYLKTRLACPDFDTSSKDKKEITNYLIHLADISNPTKPWKLCYKWIDLLFVEFFHQGDKEREKGLPVSFLMDRYTTNIAAAQGGFIDGFIRPAFEVLQQILPETSQNIKQMEYNKLQWKELETDYAPENKFTQKEEIMGAAEQRESSGLEDEEYGESEEEEDLEDSIDPNERKPLQNSTEQATRKFKYTHNSSSQDRMDRSSTF
jgi:cAMP-specific phosphodiesterase 4